MNQLCQLQLILYPVPIADEEVSHPHPSHRVARVEHIRGSYHEVIDFKLTLEEKEITASRWDRVLEKWYLIFARGRSGWPRGYDIDTLVAQKGLNGLRSISGNRSHNTILKRANLYHSIYPLVYKEFFQHFPFPTTKFRCGRLSRVLARQVGISFSFVELHWKCQLLWESIEHSTCRNGHHPKGHEHKRTGKRQKEGETADQSAQWLSVQEVHSLENFLSKEKNLIVDWFAAGCFLFALFSRSRWSDLRCVYGYAADILEVEGKITGYLEYKTRSHKTARLVQKQGLSMPLVASVWGVGKTPWVLEFIKVSKLADRPLDAFAQRPTSASSHWRRPLDPPVN